MPPSDDCRLSGRNPAVGFWRMVRYAAYHARRLGLSEVIVTERYMVTDDDGDPIHGLPRRFLEPG
jgi:hypothetical protein